MKLVVLTNNPSRASFRQRIQMHLGTLRRDGIHCEVVHYPPGSLARHKVLKRCVEFDAVYLHKKTLNFLDALWLRRYARNVIYDFDDAVMYYDKHPERKPSRRKHTKPFERTVKLSQLVIAGNSYLAEHAKKFNPNVRILPTALDTKAYSLEIKPQDDGKIRLVWIGSRSTLKYLAEIKPALEEIGARFSNVVLRIICDDFFDLENMQVEKRQWSLDSQATDLAASDIALAPLPDNRFTRGKCGFKVLQYAAAGLPAVASPVGVNSEYVLDGVTGYHASQINEWVDRISELIGNIELRRKLADAAKRDVGRFDSEVIGERLSGLITAFIKGSSSDAEKFEVKNAATVTLLPSAKPTVSICIPTYNRREYLRQALDSVVAQTSKDFEIVVVDDGSTDGTEDMIKNLTFPVTYHWQPNAGDAAARNKLVELAKGKYISFIDSDDLLIPDAVERMVKTIDAEPEDVVVYGSYLRIDQNGKIYGKCKRKLYSGNITRHLFESILVHSCGSMFPAGILKGDVPFDTSLKVCSDYDFWLRLSLKCRFIVLPEHTFKRRRHPTNLSNASFENCLTEYEVLKRFYYERGGKEVIPQKTAMKVFSKKGRRAGCCAIREGLYDRACELLSVSFRQHPNIKSLVHWARAGLMYQIRRFGDYYDKVE